MSDIAAHVIGRESELATLSDFLADGEPRGALLLTGTPGIGKTTLWEAGLELARGRGRVVLDARPTGAETQLAFAALADLLDNIDDDAFDELAPPRRRALEVALLRADPEETPPEARAIAAGLLDVLRESAQRTPLVVAIDDVQWLDRPSSEALVFAARRLRESPVAFLLTKRRGPRSPLEQALERAGLAEVEVGPLSLGATRRLLSERLGLSVPRQLLRRIVDATLGNPLFALELGRSLLERGAPRPGDDMPLPEAVDSLLGARVARLSAVARRVLLATALTDDLRASQLDPDGLDDALEAGVVLVEGDRVRASHPLLAAVAKERSRARDRSELHLELARSADEQEARALHLALATDAPDDGLATTIAVAAAAAAARGAAGQAVVLAEHAFRLTPTDSAARAERLLTLAERLLAAADDQRMADLLAPQLDSLPSGAARARALIMLADSRAAPTMRDYERLLARALEESEDDPALHATVLARKAIGVAVGSVRSIGDAEGWALEALAAARGAGFDIESEVLFALASTRTLRGCAIDDLDASFAGDRVRDLYRSLDRVAANRLAWRGDMRGARAGLERLLSLADERAQVFAYVVARGNLIDVELRAGAWDAATALLDEWEQSVDAEVMMTPTYERQRALLALGRGHVEDAASWSELAIAGGDAGGHQWHLLGALQTRALAAILAHEPELAVECLQRVWEHTEREGVEDPGAFPVAPDLVEALLEVGRLDEAEAVLARLSELSERQEHPWGLASAKRCRGLIRIAGDTYDQEAASEVEEAAADYEELGLRFDAALTLLSLGRAQRRHKKWGAARRTLERAAAAFDQLGSPGWADEARSELARVASRRPQPRGELTPTERRVVELAAQGLANKEIARTLFVTVGTVEVHLSHAYAKLGVRSRAQLAARLSSAS